MTFRGFLRARIVNLPAAALLMAACAAPVSIPPVASLDGRALQVESPTDPVLRDCLDLELKAAFARWRMAPSELNTCWVGRRMAYRGEYVAAIDWYRGALAAYPESFRIRRHLGHRLLTLRRIDEAVEVLTTASELAAAHPNRLEPDGAPGPEGEPRSTTHGNIDYHLALAHYVRGEFEAAADLWIRCLRTWSRNDDARVAALHWAYMSLIRAGESARAQALLREVGPTPDVIENFAYADLVRLYRGEVTAAELHSEESGNAALVYGLARHWIAEGELARGEERLRSIAERADWPSFGVLAAEADVARLAQGRRDAARR